VILFSRNFKEPEQVLLFTFYPISLEFCFGDRFLDCRFEMMLSPIVHVLRIEFSRCRLHACVPISKEKLVTGHC
jgi:hypothetical protein